MTCVRRIFLGLFLLWAGASAGGPLLLREVGGARPFDAEYITEVKLDRFGLLWIGTREGLWLHDGHHFRRFQSDVANPDALAGSGIRTLHEDAKGRLWVGTMTAGLSLVDRARWTFRNFRHQASEPHTLPHDSVFAICDDGAGKLWVGTLTGLALFDPETGRAERSSLGRGDGDEFVLALWRDRGGTVWAGTLGRGLFRLRPGAAAFELVARTPADVFSLAEDDGGLWVGARDGLYRVAGADVPQRVAPAPEGLVNVTSIKPDGKGILWLGSFANGLFRFDTATGRFEAEDLPKAGPGYEQRIDEGTLELTPEGGLFIGTFGMGLYYAPLQPVMFETIRGKSGDRAGLSKEDVWAVWRDGDRHLLLGSFSGGVDRLDVRTGHAEPLKPPVPPNVAASGVLSLLRARDGALWVGYTEGVYRWDGTTNTARVFHHREGDAAAMPRSVSSILEDANGAIWLGSGRYGLYRYRPATFDFDIFHHDAANPHSLSDDTVTALLEDRRGRLWIGTRSGGVNVCTKSDRALDCVRPALKPLDSAATTALLEDPSGAVWVGTAAGLQRVAPDLQSAKLWTGSDGLIGDYLTGLAFSGEGALWIATRAGLSRFERGAFENYAAPDGLPTGSFNAGAVASLGGRFYWGTAKGVVIHNPAVRPARGPPPPVLITSLEGLGRPPAPPWELSSLPVPWRHPFSLEFVVLDYAHGEAEYAYRLSPDPGWIALGSRDQVTFHELPPGDHALQIRGRTPGRAWSETRPLVLHVAPPFWQRTDVRVAAAAAALLAISAAFEWRSRQREKALAAAYAGRNRLRALTQRLQRAEEEERKRLSRELHDEFGQALTAVKLNLGLMHSSDKRVNESVSVIDGLIGHVRALSMNLRPPQLDELGLVPALENHLRSVSRTSGVEIVIDAAPSLPSLGEQNIVAFRVAQGAVTNALRHSGARRIEVRLEPFGRGVRLEVRDGGRGFDPDAILRNGSSFGLFAMQERVRDLGGRFEVRSRRGEGTLVTAEIPGGGG